VTAETGLGFNVGNHDMQQPFKRVNERIARLVGRSCSLNAIVFTLSLRSENTLYTSAFRHSVADRPKWTPPVRQSLSKTNWFHAEFKAETAASASSKCRMQ
jgi:hypothetical protein